VMMAVFCEVGRQPSRSDAFTIAVTYVRSTSNDSLLERPSEYVHLFIYCFCPIAIAYSMGQIIKSVCVCQCVSVSVRWSVCGHFDGRICWSIFTKIGTD